MAGNESQYLLGGQTPVPSNRTHLLNRFTSCNEKSIMLDFFKRIILTILMLSITMFVATMFLKCSMPYRRFVVFISVSGVKVFIFSIVYGCLCYKLSRETNLVNRLIEEEVEAFMDVCSSLIDIHTVTECGLSSLKTISSKLDVLSTCVTNRTQLLSDTQAKYCPAISNIDQALKSEIASCDPQQLTLFQKLTQDMDSCVSQIIDLCKNVPLMSGASDKIKPELLNKIKSTFEFLSKENDKNAQEKNSCSPLILLLLNNVIDNMISCKWDTQENATVRALLPELITIKDVFQETDKENQERNLLPMLYNIVEHVNSSLSIMSDSHTILSEIYPKDSIMDDVKAVVVESDVFKKVSSTKDELKSKMSNSDFLKKMRDKADNALQSTIGVMLMDKKDVIAKKVSSGIGSLIDKVNKHVFQDSGEADESVMNPKELGKDENVLCCIVLKLMLLQAFALKFISISCINKISHVDKVLRKREGDNTFDALIAR